jgi:MerR family transcriptional regulator, copper efflux regulator
MGGDLTVGQVARRAGLNSSAVRYYETHKIIPRARRLPNGYRAYSSETVDWLRFIQRAQAFGMSLADIQELLRLAIGGKMPCARVRALAREHLRQIDRNVRELQTLRAQLQKLLHRPATRLYDSQLCPLIDGEAKEAVGERSGVRQRRRDGQQY